MCFACKKMTAQMQENESTTDLIGQDWQKLLDLIEGRPSDSEIKSFDGGGHQRHPYRQDENVLRTLQDVKRLRQKDMPLFGHCPESDVFYTVVCSICGMILMPHALKDHCEKRHGETSEKSSSFDKIMESPGKLKSKKFPPPKLDKMKKSEDVKKSDINNKNSKKLKEERQPQPPPPPNPPQLEPMVRSEKPKPGSKNGVNGNKFVPDLQPVVALSPIQVEGGETEELPKKSKKDKKKMDRKVDKIYDPDKHCGVINDSGKPCVRSILCKVHQVALKRAVPNRSMPYDMLTRILKTHNDDDKTRVKIEEKSGETQLDAPTVNGTWKQDSIKHEEPPPKRLKIKEEEIIEDEGDQNQFALPSHLEALIDETLKTLKDVEENEQLPVIPVAPKPEPLLKWNFDQPLPQKSPSPPPHILLDDIHWHSSHPKPLATNTFGCRLIGGLMSTCKKLDTLRKHLQSVWSSSATNQTTQIRSNFNDIYSNQNVNQNPSKNSFAVSKYSKKPNQNKAVPIIKKNVPSPAAKRKRKNANIITPVQNSTSNASDIISGLLISNPVPIQRTGVTSVPTIPTGVIPVNSITGNGVPLRLFQGSLPVIASTAPNQPATFIQLNLCPPK